MSTARTSDRPRVGEGGDAQEHRQGERRGAEPARAERRPRRLLGPLGGAPHPHPSRPRGPEPCGTGHERREGEHERGVEAHQGTRTANVPESTISNASTISPSASGQR